MEIDREICVEHYENGTLPDEKSPEYLVVMLARDMVHMFTEYKPLDWFIEYFNQQIKSNKITRQRHFYWKFGNYNKTVKFINNKLMNEAMMGKVRLHKCKRKISYRTIEEANAAINEGPYKYSNESYQCRFCGNYHRTTKKREVSRHLSKNIKTLN